MRDGVILGTGKGNPDWNESAPHGSGRSMRRDEVKNHYTVPAYPLPFEDGNRLKLQLPFMEEPFYGILSSENSSGWYHYLYDEKDTERKDHAKSINLSYANIGLISRYSSLDWIERV